MRTLSVKQKMVLIPVLISVGGLAALVVILIFGRLSAEGITQIETDYYPALELSHDPEASLEKVQRSMQDAVAAMAVGSTAEGVGQLESSAGDLAGVAGRLDELVGAFNL